MTITLSVDGHRVEVERTASVLDAVNLAGVALPQLCKDPDRPRLGTCRSCLVAIDGRGGTPAACTVPAEDGMVVRTDAPNAVRVRRGVLQLTLDMLPEGDPTLLRELAAAAASHGITRGRFLPEQPLAVGETVDTSGPFWLLDRSRCILCQRCLDACQHVQHINAIALLGRSRDSEIGVFRHGLMTDSNCTNCGQCWATCPTHAIRLHAAPAATHDLSADPVLPARPMAAVASREGADTAVPRGEGLPAITHRVETTCPYCGVGCGLILNLGERGEIVQVDDVPENKSSVGMLCVKGRYGLDFIRAPDRLTTPLVRRERGGPLEPVSWDHALDLVAARFARHRASFGALGSAKATNEDGYVLQKFARVVMETNNVDHCARLCHSSSVVAMLEMLGSSATSNSYADFEQAGCLLVAGSDTDANHPVIAARLRKAVAEQGAALIVVNPRRIALCDIADLWLRPRPGTDVALFNGLARIALDEGLWDEDFVRRRTDGFDAWRTSLAPYSAGTVAAITGVAASDLRRAARLFARAPRGNSCLLWGMGITQHTRGVANVRALVNFALVTGQIGKPGSGLSPLRGQNNVQGCSDGGVLPDQLPGYQGLGDEARAKFGHAWSADLPAAPGLKLTEMIDAAWRGDLEALYITGENPLLTEPNVHHAREALSRLAFVVVQTIVPNETTECADVILPAATFAEKDGTFTNSERRVQMVRKALDPPGAARADWAITCDLARRVARRLGKPASGFDYAHPAAIFAEMASLVPFLGGMSHTRLEAGGLQWPCPAPDHPGTPLLFAEAFPRGRARFAIVDQAIPAAELPDRHYPLSLNTGRVLPHWHGGDLTRRVPGLVALYPEVEVAIHPADAARFAVKDGGPARVLSRRGEIVATARVTTAQARGEIFIPFVRLGSAVANLLTIDAFDPQAKIPEYKACAVRIEPAALVGQDGGDG